nr:sirohydrochlorin cobaltochelatase [Sporomusa ovata]
MVVSFGTIDIEVLKKSIESAENSFKVAFPEYDVHRAFTSQEVIKKLAEHSDLQVDGVGEALKKLAAAGYTEVHIQPLSIVSDKTYTHSKEYITSLIRSKEKEFKKMTVGRPLLLSLGLKGHPDDYHIAIEAMKTQLPELGSENAVVFMCNGSNQLEYATLQLKLADAGIKNAFVYTAEGYPTFEGVLRQLKEIKAREVVLIPFVLASSEHLLKYLAGDNVDSAKSRLEAAGYKVSVCRTGLGENPAIQAIYVQHLKDALLALEMRHGQRKGPAHA